MNQKAFELRIAEVAACIGETPTRAVKESWSYLDRVINACMVIRQDTALSQEAHDASSLWFEDMMACRVAYERALSARGCTTFVDLRKN